MTTWLRLYRNKGIAMSILVIILVFMTSWITETPENIPSAATSDMAVSDRSEQMEILAQVHSLDEFMELNKKIPILHEDVIQYETIEVMATGYTAGFESTGKDPSHPQYGITYSGIPVQRAILSTIAADPKVFPLGTLLWIPGYGYGIVADIGAAIKGKKIDLYYQTKEEVYRNWGKKKVNVLVIRRGEGKLNKNMLQADQLERTLSLRMSDIPANAFLMLHPMVK